MGTPDFAVASLAALQGAGHDIAAEFPEALSEALGEVLHGEPQAVAA